jgi:ribosomal protein L27
MRTMYVSGTETHVHSDYKIGHHHTLLKVNSGKVLYYIKMSKTSTESLLNIVINIIKVPKANITDKAFKGS